TYGYKELSMPPDANGGFKLEKNALHIWPRRSFMMIALPNADGTFTCTLFWPFTGPNSFDSLKTEAEVKQFFDETFPDAVPLMPDLVKEFMENPVGPLVTVRCSPYYSGDRAVLIGDACHAVVPFYGQGMNAAFEDCTYLNQALQEKGSIAEAFKTFGDERHEHANALADLALHNFVEMRDNVGSQGFLLKKGFERILTRLFPRSFTPLYTMVSFSRIPYADARRKAAKQDRLVLQIGVILVMIFALLVFLFVR
ncbi:MAG: kynurenine 3-monooxygenase, partial [Candidatus Eisenbacteria bacterium]|nr:kynurenine 3-monooxygenase [Candidatus Eisenbacteria bacterium]